MIGNQGPLENLPLPPGQLAGTVACLLARRWLKVPLPGPRYLQRLAGFGLMAVGCAVNAWALAERRRSEAGDFELERPTALVRTGPYALSRHPMYVGWWFIHAGSGVAAGVAWVLLTVPAAIFAEHPGVLAEEKTLENMFPVEYAEYSRHVPRYVGRQP